MRISDWSSDVCSSDLRLLLNDRPGGTEMGQLTTVEAANWMALYLATGICCAMAFALSIGMMLCAVYRERSWTAVTSWQAALLFVPRTWWRWQKLYLTSMPVTLAIGILFADSMNWG